MGRKLQGSGEGRVTRSRFALLANTDEEFPALCSGISGKKKGQSTGAAAAMVSEGVATEAVNLVPGDGQLASQEDGVHLGIELPGNPGQFSSIKQVAGNAVSIPNSEMEKKPWNSLFKDNRAPLHGLKLKFVPPKGTTLDFSDRILPSMVEMWGYCLVGFFTGKFPGLKAVYELKENWGVKCLVRSHNKGWVIFKFQSEDDRNKVLNEGPYTIFGKQLMLKVLSEDFSFDDEEFLKVPIWVKFPNLPMKLWNDEAMSEVASMVGVPLTTDKITQEKTNHNFARVLIEVDVSRAPPLSFPIRLPSRKVLKQNVVYETFPNFCFYCKEYGHHPFICKKLVEMEMNKKTVVGKMKTNSEVPQVAAPGVVGAANFCEVTNVQGNIRCDFVIEEAAEENLKIVVPQNGIQAATQVRKTGRYEENGSHSSSDSEEPEGEDSTDDWETDDGSICSGEEKQEPALLEPGASTPSCVPERATTMPEIGSPKLIKPVTKANIEPDPDRFARVERVGPDGKIIIQYFEKNRTKRPGWHKEG